MRSSEVDQQQFAGKVVVVTGAASGIGATTALHFANRGARVVGVDLNDKIHESVSGLPGTGHLAIAKDLTIVGAADEVVSEAIDAFDSLEILVNSAGIALLDPALSVSRARWQATLDVNLTSSFFMSQAVGRVMVDAGFGRIINLASQASVIGLAEHAAYCASKAAIVGLTRVLSLEWAPHGVTVNSVSPTVVETPMGKTAWAGEKGERARAEIPMGRFAQPEEVAALIAYLAGDDASMITGSNVMIDGGRTSV